VRAAIIATIALFVSPALADDAPRYKIYAAHRACYDRAMKNRQECNAGVAGYNVCHYNESVELNLCDMVAETAYATVKE
jgi:uncharacterized membrane protein